MKSIQPNQKAIILAHFGTTHPSALESLENTKRAIQEAFPKIPVRISFTSNQIRNIWKKRREDGEFWTNQGVSEEVLYAKSILGIVGELQDLGFRTLVVQPTYIAHGEQYEDLRSHILGLRSIQTIKTKWMPFEKIVLSRPILGTRGILYDFKEDIKEMVASLSDDINFASKKNADLIYVGHGNEYFSTGIYPEAQKEF